MPPIKATPQKKAPLNNEENKFQKLFESFSLGIIYQDKQGKVTDANTAALKILGYSLKEIQGKTPYSSNRKFINEDFSIHPTEDFPCATVLETGKPLLNKIVGFLAPDKNAIQWVKIDCTPLFNNTSKTPYQIYTTFTDITTTKNNEILLKENEQKYLKAQQIDKSGNWEYNFKSQELWASLEIFKIFGINPNKHKITLNLLENCIIDKELIASSIDELLEKGEVQNIELTIQPYKKLKKKKHLHKNKSYLPKKWRTFKNCRYC